VNPAQLQRKIQEGISLQQRGRLTDADAAFAQIRNSDPKNFDGWHLGGNIALLQGQPATAATLYARAIRLNPKSAVAATCLGVARMALGDFPGAEPHLRTALRLEPRNAEIWNQLATLLSASGRPEEAVKCHRQAVTFNPKSAQAWHGYASTLSNLNLPAEALDYEKRAIAADPAYVPARRGYAVALQKCHRITEAVREYDALLAQNPRQLDVQSHRLFALNYLSGQTPESLYAAHRAYGELVEKGAAPASFSNSPDHDRKLRVAFFSADFREHSVAYFMEPLIRLMDRNQFEIFLYNFCNKPDAVTARFRDLADVWRDFPSTVENVVEPVVRADALDLAVDLGGHTGESLLPLFARRIAPVQISYLGYPNTTGLKSMDYRLVDNTTDPASEADRLHTETLVRFSSCAWVYEPPAHSPAPAPPPCLKNGHITFGSFNNFSKVTDEMLATWARLLNDVPGSRLLLKSIGLSDPAITKQIEERLRQAGLPVERVELAGPKGSTVEHLATYSLIDIALDTTPYNGTTTTCEALWMGVPVVTLTGNRHAARVSTSLLQTIGHREWIAGNFDEYIVIAKALAHSPARLEVLRGNLRDELMRSSLMDQPGKASEFGNALRDCWRKWCQAT
jgi:predicted O-linked N-acetylglucosamine transferase (SPINDLY family)